MHPSQIKSRSERNDQGINKEREKAHAGLDSKVIRKAQNGAVHGWGGYQRYVTTQTQGSLVCLMFI